MVAERRGKTGLTPKQHEAMNRLALAIVEHMKQPCPGCCFHSLSNTDPIEGDTHV